MSLSFKLSYLSVFLLLLISFTGYAQEEQDSVSSCHVNLSEKAKKKYQEAVSFYNKKQYTESTKFLKEIIDEEPEYADTYFWLGMIAMQKENTPAMQKHFLQVLSLCPNYKNPNVYYYLGIIAYSGENFEKATEYFNTFFKVFEAVNNPEYEHLYQDARNYQEWSSFLGKMYSAAVPFNPQVVKGLSTSKTETLPYVSVDGTKIYYIGTTLEDDPEAVFEKSTIEKLRLFCAEKQADGSFKGEPMPSPFNTKDNEGYVTTTPDNKLLYYTICKYDKEYFNCDIYYSEFKNGEWQPLQNAGRNINMAATWESQPSITPDGKWIYFASNRKGGFGGTDIWRAKRLPGGDWGRAENLGSEVNTAGDEKSPFIHPDGVTLYFSSNGWKTLGGFDVFYKRLDDPSMKMPANLGHPINTEDDEIDFCISTSGKKGYFSSTKYKTTSDLDIFEFDLYEKARPRPVTLIKGTLLDETGNPSSGTISFRKNDNSESIDFPVYAQDGSFTAAIRSDFNYVMIAKREGYAHDSKYLTRNALQKDSLTVNMQIRPIDIGGSYQLNDIMFESNSAELCDIAKFIIDAFVDFLQENPSLHIAIEGHTDNIGNAAENMELSTKRAQAVYDYLLQKRIRKDRLNYKGHGASQPIADNNTEEGRAKNRRTVFVITQK